MAFNKRTWKGRQGTGLNKFSINGATPVTVINQPDSVTEQGDALSAGNLNDLEQRIYDAFDDIADGTQIVGKATADASGNVIDQTYATKADLQDGTLVVKEAEIASKDEDGNNIKATYETKADASDLKSALTAIDHRVENLEQPKGGYVVQNYKDGSITPSGKGAWSIVEGLRGVSRVENNLVNPADSSTSTVNGITFTNNGDGSWTISGATGSSPAQKQIVPYNMKANHSYLLAGARNNVILAYIGQGTDRVDEGSGIVATITTDTYKALFIYVRANVTFSSPVTIRPISTDLNVYFNTTDLSFLGATDSDKLATIQKDYPHLLIPSEYGVRIVDSSYSGVRAKGVNLWNEKWIVGGLNNYTGLPDASRTNRVSSEDFIPISQYKLYYYLNTADVAWLYFYDKDKNYIGRHDSNSASFTPLAGSAFMKFETWNGYGNVYKHDVQISEVFNNTVTTLNTTYHPYMESTLSLSFTGKSAGSVSEMYYPETGEQTHPIGQVDLGTPDWRKYGQSFFYAQISTKKIGSPVVCDRYAYGGSKGDAEMASVATGIYVGFTTQEIKIKDDSLIGMTTSEFRAAMSGVMLNYPLATPDPSTFVTPIIDNTLLTEAGGRMSTVQTGTVVDGSFDMGFITL